MAEPPVATLLAGAAQLRDIHGIAGVPWWPLGIGWWWLAGAALVSLILLRIGLVLWRRHQPAALRLPLLRLGSWRGAAARELLALRRHLPRQPAKDSAGQLSELLRRIAIARCGRGACAGLTGTAWLRWLRANDPQAFDWEEHAGLLLAAPYAPPGGSVQEAALLQLIEAAEAWVTAPVGPCRGIATLGLAATDGPARDRIAAPARATSGGSQALV